ncbi:flagellar hook-associated protein FlgK [Lysinibacillus yapensis]|uniref:Flagellar hook-associated protein 1 n=1 Tax=Ureibacillus yapensis TaxID=2304605 RepID=A0A396SI11_9BACL|nr:flagellar hook-associated protein FlgK [Lysinibacillus yapensis]RHW39938.1 flagellar hook-associated protein FlgK [Lysinibacillus yapensis]
MRSTFMGLEASKRGLFTQQSALYTTGHNISNANTEGYSRQRVNMQPTLPYPGVGLNNDTNAGYIGTGVEAGSVQRIRDSFIDKQYRQEATKLGYWEARSQSITEMEDILTEPSDYGLAQSLNDFYNSLQDLNVNPEDGGARAVVVQRGIAVADSFHYMHNSIQQIKENAASEIGILLRDANSILEQIAGINAQIQAVEPNGYLPNDLYDARDNLIDKLSTYFPVETTKVQSGGNALANAEGSLTVSLKLNGVQSITLVEGKNFAKLSNRGTNTETPTGMVTGLGGVDSSGDSINADINIFNSLGKFKSLVDSYGYKSNVTTPASEKGLFPDMLKKLDTLAKEFADAFNSIHKKGTDLKGVTGKEFFVSNDTSSPITGGNIYVSQTILNDASLIAASDSLETTPIPTPEPGNGKNALALANIKFKNLNDQNGGGNLGGVSVQTYFEGLIGQLGVDGQQAERLKYNSETLKQAVTEKRASVSSVSLDEEMTNMITFQQAYNANARMISVIDETLDKIINGMGRVGL